jgi:hypothetical protein
VLAVAPHWANGMDHKLRWQLSRTADHGRTGWTTIRIAATSFRHDGRAAGAVNGTVHAASARETAIGRVDDRVNLLTRDVAQYEFQRLAADR